MKNWLPKQILNQLDDVFGPNICSGSARRIPMIRTLNQARLVNDLLIEPWLGLGSIRIINSSKRSGSARMKFWFNSMLLEGGDSPLCFKSVIFNLLQDLLKMAAKKLQGIFFSLFFVLSEEFVLSSDHNVYCPR